MSTEVVLELGAEVKHPALGKVIVTEEGLEKVKPSSKIHSANLGALIYLKNERVWFLKKQGDFISPRLWRLSLDGRFSHASLDWWASYYNYDFSEENVVIGDYTVDYLLDGY